MAAKTPVISDGGNHLPLNAADHLDIISSDSGNLLQVGADNKIKIVIPTCSGNLPIGGQVFTTPISENTGNFVGVTSSGCPIKFTVFHDSSGQNNTFNVNHSNAITAGAFGSILNGSDNKINGGLGNAILGIRNIISSSNFNSILSGDGNLISSTKDMNTVVGRRNIIKDTATQSFAGGAFIVIGNDALSSFAFGSSCQILSGQNQSLFGEGNVISSPFNNNFGAGGRSNQILNGTNNLISGSSNVIGANGQTDGNLVSGSTNKLTGLNSNKNFNFVSGLNNTVDGAYCSVISGISNILKNSYDDLVQGESNNFLQTRSSSIIGFNQVQTGDFRLLGSTIHGVSNTINCSVSGSNCLHVLGQNNTINNAGGTVLLLGALNTKNTAQENGYGIGVGNVLGDPSLTAVEDAFAIGRSNLIAGRNAGGFGWNNRVYGQGSYALGESCRIGTNLIPVIGAYAIGRGVTNNTPFSVLIAGVSQNLGFYGVTPVARQALPASPTVAQIRTVLFNLGLVS